MNFTFQTLVRLLTCTGLALGLATCATTSTISLDYQAPGQTITGPRKVAAGRFIDHRQVDPYYIGTVRTPIGTPIEQISTRIPVEQVVRNAFAHALGARNMLSSQDRAEFIITGEILDLYTDQVVRPGAYAKIRVNLVREGSGQILFSRIYEGQRSGSAYLPGSGSPVANLRELASRALQDAVDRALDDPSMRSRINAGGGPRRPMGSNVL